ncbi:MAG: cysteine--tRNA ligase [Coriobacteriia bacterium]|nr:cysteine--tRNA ligase [Coriobacteriia bacterium]
MLKIYNTQNRKKEEFKPVKDNKIGMYVCGPTVYNRIHIGNARTFISFDIIRRYLIWRGYDVIFVQNVTDVDDKIIARANEENTTAEEIAKKYTQLFIEDMHAANVLDPDVRPKATQEIGEMIKLVKALVDNGNAYVVDGDVYFDVRSYNGYGSLSGRDIDEGESGHRDLRTEGIEDRKRDEADFALWKAAKPGEPSWGSPWGQGRPGWHIECSAMSHKYLGLPFDIHGGGSDLIFPHHENERAQSICAYDSGFANYWMHTGMLQITNDKTGDNEKMSKSLNNFVLLYEALEQVRPATLRMLSLQTHYRSPLVFGQKRIDEAEAALKRIENTVNTLNWEINNTSGGDKDIDINLKDKFIEAMDDDFNTSKALGEIFAFIAEINSTDNLSNASKQAAVNIIKELMDAFGVELEQQVNYPDEVIELAAKYADFKGNDKTEAIEAILQARAEARQNKNWDIADGIRDDLSKFNLQIEDTPDGSRVVQS